ncbi:hypothetical protein GCM10027299_03150 [Larkinella ripae]
MFRLKKRPVFQAETLVAPWSHYWGGYYDLLVSIGPKLCRIEQALPDKTFNEALISYPLLNTPFELELLQLLGYKLSSILDSRIHSVKFNTVLTGNSSDWFYPHSDDIMRFKNRIENRIPLIPAEPKRIYIRRAGRRRVLNEEQLITLLLKYDFEIIEDQPGTIADQVALYHNASFIIGPHGASFANILWCKPGTRLLELFSKHYVPDYYRYLAQLLDLDYFAYAHDPVAGRGHRHVNEDITVSIVEIEKALDLILEKSSV